MSGQAAERSRHSRSMALGFLSRAARLAYQLGAVIVCLVLDHKPFDRTKDETYCTRCLERISRLGGEWF